MDGKPLRKAVLPVDAEALGEALEDLHREGPKAVLHLGLAEDRPVLTLERLAVNLLDFPAPTTGAGSSRTSPSSLEAPWPFPPASR